MDECHCQEPKSSASALYVAREHAKELVAQAYNMGYEDGKNSVVLAAGETSVEELLGVDRE